MDFAINAKPLERYMPTDKKSFNYKIWKLVVSSGFEYFILTMIALNTIILTMKVNSIIRNENLFLSKYLFIASFYFQWYNQHEQLIRIMKYLNIAFTTLFTIECILKILAFGIKVSLYNLSLYKISNENLCCENFTKLIGCTYSMN